MVAKMTAALPVPSLRGARGVRAPPTTACAPHFGLLRILFGASRSDTTTGNNGKRNNNVLSLFLFEVFSILYEIAGNLYEYINVMQ